MNSNSQKITELFRTQKVLIVGDVMIDSYIWGKVDRISPEAPVPIVNVTQREKRLGGAANVALNIQGLGAEAILCSVVGNDSEGQSFYSILKNQNLRNEGILKSDSRITSIKHRVISNSQHMLRIDQEDTHLINQDESNDLFNKIEAIINKEAINVLVFEDYDKGVLTPILIRKIIELCNRHNIPTVVDPKKRNFFEYKGVTLFKPNLKELKEGLKIEFNSKNIDEIISAGKSLIEILKCDNLFITLSELGVLYLDKKSNNHIKAHKREIADVSGAGDTVVSVAALCLGAKLDKNLLAELSNLAGGIVCEKVGVVPLSIDELINESVRLKII